MLCFGKHQDHPWSLACLFSSLYITGGRGTAGSEQRTHNMSWKYLRHHPVFTNEKTTSQPVDGFVWGQQVLFAVLYIYPDLLVILTCMFPRLKLDISWMEPSSPSRPGRPAFPVLVIGVSSILVLTPQVWEFLGFFLIPDPTLRIISQSWSLCLWVYLEMSSSLWPPL